MKKLIVFVFAITVASLGYAENGNGKNNGRGNRGAHGNSNHDNAAQGTKVLMERIAALEAIVNSLVGYGNEVSGGRYLMIAEVNHLWAGNEFPGHGVAFSLGQQEYEFYSDGTGISQVLSCDGNRLHDQDFNNTDIAYFTSAPACQVEDTDFTYEQYGNDLLIQFAAFSSPINYTVSDSGDAFVSATVNFRSNVPCEDSACTLSTAGTFVNRAMRVGDSE